MEKKRLQNAINKPVFYTSSALILCLVCFAVLTPSTAAELFNSIQNFIVTNLSWFYVLTMAVVFAFSLFLGFSRIGEVKLGPDHAVAEFSFITWLSMLFSAGIGIGLMFFGVAEPLMHFLSPPVEDPRSIAAAQDALKVTFFHWGLNAWSIYALVALILGYFAYRQNLPLTLRSALYPLMGDKIYGWPGHIVDILAVTSTVFGIATSLGFGALQINSGFNYLFDLPNNAAMQTLIMVVVIGFAMLSVMSGLDKGIRRLSEVNMSLAVLLLILVLVLGPTVFLLQAFMQNTGTYLSDIVFSTFNLFAYEKTDWIGGWTIFYWGWWIAWAPFVGIFIARISYGRTIREFVWGVLLVPATFTLFWMTVFGNSAIDQVINQGNEALATMVSEDSSVALFVFLESFPFSTVLSLIAVLMVIVFFVTSCDSGAMVIDMLCSFGKNDTPLWQRVYWAGGVGVVGIVLLYAGGLGALQTMTIAAALPFAIVIILSMFGLFKALKVEAFKRESLAMDTGSPLHNDSDKNWKERLDLIVMFPDENAVSRFLEQTVSPALNEVTKEFITKGFNAELQQNGSSVLLKIAMGDDPEFVYGVYNTVQDQPYTGSISNEILDEKQKAKYHRAEVYLGEGGQNYDIMGWSKISVINDVIDHYHKHQHFIHMLR